MADLPVRQRVVRFETGDGEWEEDEEEEEDWGGDGNGDGKASVTGDEMEKQQRQRAPEITRWEDAVDFTPPNLISALITENGVLTPSAVSEELIKLWF